MANQPKSRGEESKKEEIDETPGERARQVKELYERFQQQTQKNEKVNLLFENKPHSVF